MILYTNRSNFILIKNYYKIYIGSEKINRYNKYSYMEKQENPTDIYHIYRNKRKESLAQLNLQAATNNIEKAAAVALKREIITLAKDKNGISIF